MTEDVNHIIVSYDISHAKRLRRVAKMMKNYGTRVLKSVFECNLDTPKYIEMKHGAEKIIDPQLDTIRFYFLCDKCIKNVDKVGKGDAFIEDDEVTII